ncbi:MAG: outer membrane protein [Halorhodospira sp.]
MRVAKYIAPAFVSALAFGSTAQAADFDGFYAGGGLGVFGSATADFSVDGIETNGLDVDSASATFGAEDFLNKADLIVGYGQQDDGIYLGAEASYSLGMLDEEIIKGGGESVDLETNGGYTLAGRLGYVVAPTTMAYAKLGYQQREFELSIGGDSGDEDFDGYVIGGGMAYQLSGAPVTVRAEATRTDYGDEGREGVDVEPTETSVDLQAVYRF